MLRYDNVENGNLWENDIETSPCCRDLRESYSLRIPFCIIIHKWLQARRSQELNYIFRKNAYIDNLYLKIETVDTALRIQTRFPEEQVNSQVQWLI